MKIPKLSILISLAAHMAFIGALIWGGSLLLSPEEHGGTGGSEGAVVSVWLAGPSGEVISGTQTGKIRSLTTSKKTMPHEETPDRQQSFDGRKSAGSGDSAGGTTGIGVGSGTGKGAGARDSGDPILAKIWKKIDRKKYYPSIARRNGIEGTPKVTFEITEDGGIKWLKLASSCGYAMLDDAAMITIRRAAPLPYYPRPITLAIRYSISD